MLVVAPQWSGQHGPRYDLDNDTYIAFQPRYYTRDNKPGGQPSDTADITNCHKAGDSAPHVAFTVHGEHSTAMTGKGNAKVAFETECARSLDSCGGYATNQGGNVIAFDYCAQGSERTRIVRSGEYAQVIAGRPDAIAFDRTRGTSSGDITGPLRKCGAASEGVNDAKADTQCVAYGVSENQRAELRLTPYSRQITSGGGKPGQGYPCVAFTERTRADGRNLETQEEMAYALTNPGSGGRTHSRQIAGAWGVRRLTPTECERLQGFPDGWTAVLGERATRIDEETIQYLRCQYCCAYGVVLSDDDVKLIQSDSARYKELGNAVCVNVIVWIGKRMVDLLDNEGQSVV